MAKIKGDFANAGGPKQLDSSKDRPKAEVYANGHDDAPQYHKADDVPYDRDEVPDSGAILGRFGTDGNGQEFDSNIDFTAMDSAEFEKVMDYALQSLQNGEQASVHQSLVQEKDQINILNEEVHAPDRNGKQGPTLDDQDTQMPDRSDQDRKDNIGLGRVAGFTKNGRSLAGFIDYSDEDDVVEEDDEDNLFVFPDHPMDLRPRTFKFIDPTTFDIDESGDYDPNAKALPVREPKKRRSTADQPAADTAPREPAVLTEKEIRQEGHQYCVTLSFNSKRALRAFARLTSKYKDNWPDDSKTLWEDDDLGFIPNDTYAFRERPKPDKPSDYYLLNTPNARACKRCLELNPGEPDCSMLQPDGTYPCAGCMDEGETCIPAVEPKWKNACENCAAQREPCSYIQDPSGDHTGRCDRCEHRDFQCIAGPQYDPLRTRIGHDGKPATPQPTPNQQTRSYARNFKTCAPCRRQLKWCSLTDAKRSSEPPCVACRRAGKPCTFEAVPRQMPAKTSDAEIKKRKRPTKRDIQLSREETRVIRTSLSHPITFLAASTTGTKKCACHWCMNENPFYAILGHGEDRDVKVIVWPNGAGLEEYEGGHTLDGCEPSRMCRTCTLDRVRIVECDMHELRPLPGTPSLPREAGAGAEDLRKALPIDLVEELMAFAAGPSARRPASSLRPEITRSYHRRWCAVCPNAASFECCTPSADARAATASSRTAGGLAHALAAEQRGCGLRLCWTCAMLLRDFFKGRFQDFLREMSANAPVQWYSRGMRADYEFLRVDGLMWRQLEHLKARYGGKLPDLG